MSTAFTHNVSNYLLMARLMEGRDYSGALCFRPALCGSLKVLSSAFTAKGVGSSLYCSLLYYWFLLLAPREALLNSNWLDGIKIAKKQMSLWAHLRFMMMVV